MRLLPFRVAGAFLLCGGLAAALGAQGEATEVNDLRLRVAAIRANLPQVTAVAEKSAKFLSYENTGRLLVPHALDPSFSFEFYARAGGPPDTRNAEESDLPGLVLLPVRHWSGVGLGVAATAERWQAMQRPVVFIGPARDRPAITLPGSFLDDGAPTGDRAGAPVNGIANMVVGWTFYSEIVAAASRAGWQPGILLTVMAPSAALHNEKAKFHSAGTPATVPAGQLGRQYLDAVDSLLLFASTPAHRKAVDEAVERMRAARKAGHRIFVASCGHYLQEEIPPDSVASPFVPLDMRKEMLTELSRHLAAPHDVMLWFGYGGYNCPNADVAESFRVRQLDVILVTNMPPDPSPREIMATIPLWWRLPDAVADIPFSPGHLAPVSSVEMALHYLWLRRLAAEPN